MGLMGPIRLVGCLGFVGIVGRMLPKISANAERRLHWALTSVQERLISVLGGEGLRVQLSG